MAPLSYAARLHRLAESRPDAPVTVVGDATHRWGDVVDDATRIARTLQELGVTDGDLVTIAYTNSLAVVATTFACGTEAAPGETGEVFMRPPEGVTTYRYVGADATRTDDGWEILGDLGWMDADGYLHLGDRKKDMILTGGANVYPAEVEAAFDRHPAVQSCAVVGIPDDDLGQRIHAIVHAGEPLDDETLRAHLADELVRYEIPRTFEFVDKSVRDDAGKVRRSLLARART